MTFIKITSGSLGHAFTAVDLETEKIVVMKEFEFHGGSAGEKRAQATLLSAEIEKLRNYHHPHIVSFLGSEIEDKEDGAFVFRIFQE